MDAPGPTSCALTHGPFPLVQRISAYMAEPQWRRVAQALYLTGRKLEIARALFDGLSEEAVAQKLGISRHTVHNHVRYLYLLLDVHSRNELFHRIAATHLEINLGDGRPNQESERKLSEKTTPPIRPNDPCRALSRPDNPT